MLFLDLFFFLSKSSHSIFFPHSVLRTSVDIAIIVNIFSNTFFFMHLINNVCQILHASILLIFWGLYFDNILHTFTFSTLGVFSSLYLSIYISVLIYSYQIQYTFHFYISELYFAYIFQFHSGLYPVLFRLYISYINFHFHRREYFSVIFFIHSPWEQAG